MSEPNPFARQSYISVETYRKNGQPVRTPVWFAQNETCREVYVWTDITSGKAKRIRNNPEVKLAPSNGTGTPKGPYQLALAHLSTEGSPEFKTGVELINKKYGLLKKIFEMISGSKEQHTLIVLKLAE
jgi:PPOX class probable F420-dependent enzyme